MTLLILTSDQKQSTSAQKTSEASFLLHTYILVPLFIDLLTAWFSMVTFLSSYIDSFSSFETYFDIRPKAINKRAKIERSEIFATYIHVPLLMDLLLGLQWWPFSQKDSFSSFESWNLFWHQTKSNQQTGKNRAKRDFCYIYTCFTLMDILLVFSQVASFSSFGS